MLDLLAARGRSDVPVGVYVVRHKPSAWPRDRHSKTGMRR
jgi:hypothetical protein